MITCFAHGFIAEKPAVELVGAKNCKCEFTVLWSRSVRRGDGWDTVWERAIFVAWDDEAERVASRLDKGSRVTCTGTQETFPWQDSKGQKRYITKYRLTSWNVEIQRQQQSGDSRGSGNHAQPHDRFVSAGQRPNPRPESQRPHQPRPHRESDFGDGGFDEPFVEPVQRHPARPDGYDDGDDFIRM